MAFDPKTKTVNWKLSERIHYSLNAMWANRPYYTFDEYSKSFQVRTYECIPRAMYKYVPIV